MRSNRCLLCSTAVLVVASSLASATNQRTFVASIGTDNPACSISSPCRSFAAAITATNPSGELIVEDSAGYGPVTITESVSIIAPPGIYAGISVSSGNGVTINAPGATVVLRGLSINGQGGANGILVQAAARVRIENCVVSNMGIVGIYHHADNAEVIVLDTISRDNGDTGVALVAQNASIVLDHVRSEHNVSVGFYTAPSGPGVVLATISDSLFAQNGGNGILADSLGFAQTTVSVERTTVTRNGGEGIKATSAASASFIYLYVAHSAFSFNQGAEVRALGNLPGGLLSYISENSIAGSPIIADGSGSEMFASGNMGGSYLSCKNGATLRTFGDNHVSNGADLNACASFSGISPY